MFLSISSLYHWIFSCFILYHQYIIAFPGVSFHIISMSFDSIMFHSIYHDYIAFPGVSFHIITIYNWIPSCFIPYHHYINGFPHASFNIVSIPINGFPHVSFNIISISMDSLMFQLISSVHH